MLVNRPVLSENMLRSIWRRDLLLPLFLGGGSRCKDVLSKIALLDKIFKDTYGEIDIEKFGVTGCRGRNNSLLLRDEHGRVFLPPDASYRVDP